MRWCGQTLSERVGTETREAGRGKEGMRLKGKRGEMY
jgi:hypothetical protein